MTALFCYANYQSFAEVQQMAAEKDPITFGGAKDAAAAAAAYGATGPNGVANKPTEISDEEREELKAQVMASSSRLCSKCCSHGFLLFIVMLFVGKINGAGYSALWIISPVLIIVGMILCCIGFAIFGITEVSTDGVEFDTATSIDVEAPPTPAYTPPQEAVRPPAGGNVELSPTNSTKASNTSSATASPPSAAPAVLIPQPPPQPVQPPDLLDDPPNVKPELNELD